MKINISATKIEDITFNVLNALLMVLLSAITLYPFWNTIAVSFNEALDTVRGGINLLPRKWTLYNYKVIFSNSAIFHAFFISVARTVINMVTSVFFTAMIAYVLSRKNFVFRKPFTVLLVLSMYVNAGLIPTYFLMKNLHLLNSFLVYIIPGIIYAFNFIVVRTYLQTIPESIIESVRIDGGSDFTIFLKIVLPLSRPVLATIALFVAVGAWNMWFDTMIYNSGRSELHTLQYKLMEYLQSSQAQSRSASDVGSMSLSQSVSVVTPVSIRAAITVIAALPILVVYPFMQRHFVVGLNVGGVKE
ncbi:MAG: carbohydrate ABC transporter permease [Spirochaetales bacterium]|nr:carbohydrate ABC transporter permease [Spirochaetales bacterium]